MEVYVRARINIVFPAVITIIDSGQTAILFVYEYMMAVSKAVPDGRDLRTVRVL